MLFGSLIVHELGHALVARRQGIEVEKINLNLFGGLTQMTRDAASPGEDFKVAIAGPLATFGVILLCLAIDLPIVGTSRLGHAIVLDSTIRITPVLLSLSWLLLMNVLLLAFNILPAFPLDGGRVARSIVWRVTGDKRRGTVAASRMGQGLALLMAGLGLCWTAAAASFGGVWLIALAYLMWQSCKGALLQSSAHRAHRGRPGRRHHGHPSGGDPGRDARDRGRWTRSSCATGGHGSRSSMTPAICSGSHGRSGPRPRSTAARRG